MRWSGIPVLLLLRMGRHMRRDWKISRGLRLVRRKGEAEYVVDTVITDQETGTSGPYDQQEKVIFQARSTESYYLDIDLIIAYEVGASEQVKL